MSDQKKTCGSCAKYKGMQQECGQKSVGGYAYIPADMEVGPCLEGYVPKPVEEVSPICGNCTHYKGAKISCGQKQAPGSPFSYTPQSSTDSCCGRQFEAKRFVVSKEKKELWLKEIKSGPYRKDVIQNASGKTPFDLAIDLESKGLDLKHKYPFGHKHVTETPFEKAIDLDTGLGIKTLHYVNSSNQKQVSTTMITNNAIIRLADSQYNKEVEDFGGLQVDLKEALQEMQEQRRRDAAKAAATEVMNTLKKADEYVEAGVSEIRHFRKAVELVKVRLENIAEAKAYGMATSNFIPLAVLVGTVYAGDVENKELLKVDKTKIPKAADGKEAV